MRLIRRLLGGNWSRKWRKRNQAKGNFPLNFRSDTSPMDLKQQHQTRSIDLSFSFSRYFLTFRNILFFLFFFVRRHPIWPSSSSPSRCFIHWMMVPFYWRLVTCSQSIGFGPTFTFIWLSFSSNNGNNWIIGLYCIIWWMFHLTERCTRWRKISPKKWSFSIQ